MAGASEFVAHVVETLAPLGGVSARRMFGGHGIFKDGLMFALVADDLLYLKTDDQNRPTYEAAGLGAFTYVKRGKPMAMSYREAPPEGFDDPDVLRDWAAEAFAAALRVILGVKRVKRPLSADATRLAKTSPLVVFHQTTE